MFVFVNLVPFAVKMKHGSLSDVRFKYAKCCDGTCSLNVKLTEYIDTSSSASSRLMIPLERPVGGIHTLMLLLFKLVLASSNVVPGSKKTQTI